MSRETHRLIEIMSASRTSPAPAAPPALCRLLDRSQSAFGTSSYGLSAAVEKQASLIGP